MLILSIGLDALASDDMSNFQISPRDQLHNPGKIYEEMMKFAPDGLKTSRSQRDINPFGFTLFNLSEILMRIPAFDSPANAMERFENLVSGTMGSFWDPENIPGIANLVPGDLLDALNAANPDGMGEEPERSGGGGGGGSDDGGDAFSGTWDIATRDGITPSTKPTGVNSRTKPVAVFGAQITRRVLGHNGTILGQQNRADKRSDHNTGHALDIMVSSGRATGKQKRMGDLIAAFFHHNRRALNVSYIIWYERIASSRDNWKWRYYERGRGQSVTWKHQDHPHISFTVGSPAPRNPKLTWPDGVPVP